MNRLTRQEQLVLCIIVCLLLTGWAVKAYRVAHPPAGMEARQSMPGEGRTETSGEQAKH